MQGKPRNGSGGQPRVLVAGASISAKARPGRVRFSAGNGIGRSPVMPSNGHSDQAGPGVRVQFQSGRCVSRRRHGRGCPLSCLRPLLQVSIRGGPALTLQAVPECRQGPGAPQQGAAPQLMVVVALVKCPGRSRACRASAAPCRATSGAPCSQGRGQLPWGQGRWKGVGQASGQPQGPGRGVQAIAEEMGTQGWAGVEGSLRSPGWAGDGCHGEMGWGWVSLRSKGLVVGWGSVQGGLGSGPWVPSGEPWDSGPGPAKVL